MMYKAKDHVLWKIFCLDMEIDADKTNFLFVLLHPFRFSLFVRTQIKLGTFHQVSLQYIELKYVTHLLIIHCRQIKRSVFAVILFLCQTCQV